MHRFASYASWTLVMGFATALLSMSTPARADEVVIVNQHPEGGYSGPSRSMIGGGIVVFGVTYGASAIVASTSDHPGDKDLYIPLAGPWFDLADRGPCGGAGQRYCDTETVNKVLLVGDGILQGLGVLTIVSGLLTPERQYVTTTRTKAPAAPTVRITPLHYKGGLGVGAVGTF